MKIGDWVTIRSREWYEQHRNYYGYITGHESDFIPSMAGMCGQKLQIVSMTDKDHIRLSVGPQGILWASWMLEEAYEDGDSIVQVAENTSMEPPRTRMPKGKKSYGDGKGDIS